MEGGQHHHRWSLLLTAPNSEGSVSRRLINLGFEHLFIRHKTLRIFHGRKIESSAAAFPRYIFIVANEAWEFICGIRGVIDFVRIGNEPARISEQIISNLRARLDGSGLLPTPEKSKFAFGQRVLIKTNSIGEREAIFQFALPYDRAFVMQQWFGSYRNVEVDQSDLISLEQFAAIKRSRRKRKQEQRLRRRLLSSESMNAPVTARL